VHVDEGLQYRLSGIRFANADPERELAIPEEQLRKVIQIRDGEILNVDNVRRGVEALTKFYGTIGYVDFTAEPRLETDDAHRRISVLMRLSEQKQYTIAKVDVLSQDPELETELRSTIKAGNVYNHKLIEDFFTKHKSILPPDSSPMTSIKFERDVKTGIVNLVFDFRDPCAPQAD
jgi:outer membrane protein assembly factor BamA